MKTAAHAPRGVLCQPLDIEECILLTTALHSVISGAIFERDMTSHVSHVKLLRAVFTPHHFPTGNQCRIAIIYDHSMASCAVERYSVPHRGGHAPPSVHAPTLQTTAHVLCRRPQEMDSQTRRAATCVYLCQTTNASHLLRNIPVCQPCRDICCCCSVALVIRADVDTPLQAVCCSLLDNIYDLGG